MTTTLDRYDTATLSRTIRIRRKLKVLKPLPCSYCGIQEGYGRIPAIELYTIKEGIEGHPCGSTISINTLTAKGYIPAIDHL